MNVKHCCQMAQLVAEEMGFGQGWNSPSHTFLKIDQKKACQNKKIQVLRVGGGGGEGEGGVNFYLK